MARLGKLLFLGNTQMLVLSLFVWVVLLTSLVDPDYFWHLKTGEWIVGHGRLPAGDVFSYTRAGQPWVEHEWLFEVLLYLTWHYAGALGVKALAASLFLGTFGLALSAASRVPRTTFEPAIVAPGAILLFFMGLSARPQLLTFLGVAAVLWILFEFKYRQRLRQLMLLPLIAVPWVNFHGGYVIGVAMVVLFAACEWCQYLVAPKPAQRRQLARLTVAAILMILATLANPWFIEHWRYPFQVLGMGFNVHIDEWKSPDFHELGPQIYLAMTFIFALAAARAQPRLDLTEWALPATFVMLGFVSQRHIPLASLVLLAFGSAALTRGKLAAEIAGWLAALIRRPRALAAQQPGKARPHARPGPAPEAAPRARLRESARNWAMLGVTILAGAASAPRLAANDELRLTRAMPVGAADFIAKAGLHGRMFNSYNHGGYLIYRFGPALKVAVDGRADMYGDDFLTEYQRAYTGQAGWKSTFDKLKVDFVLLPCDAPLRQLLVAEHSYREVYRDEDNVVMVRAGSAQAAALPRVSATRDKHATGCPADDQKIAGRS
jgi:hypothetical protein